jgi:hypothetical protein
LHLEFTLNLSIIFIGSFDIRASREFFSNEVRISEITDSIDENETTNNDSKGG